MPIYEYTCSECNTQFEKFVRSMTGKVEAKCPHCGSTHTKKGWSLFGTGNRMEVWIALRLLRQPRVALRVLEGFHAESRELS